MASLWAWLKRTIFGHVVIDHLDTFSSAIDDETSKREKWRTALLQYGLPLGLGAFFWILRIELGGVSALLSGMAILTALLFALLVLMFDTTITMRKDSDVFISAHDIKMVVSSLRMNVTYAVLVSILLSALLIVAAAVGSGKVDEGGFLWWVWTPVLTFWFAHLGLTLIMILKRLRQAFNYIER